MISLNNIDIILESLRSHFPSHSFKFVIRSSPTNPETAFYKLVCDDEELIASLPEYINLSGAEFRNVCLDYLIRFVEAHDIIKSNLQKKL